jgi:uncharacterized membrane protein YphA (DoxX/SURF4 family)
MFEKKILNIYSVIIGIFFFISGLGKLFDTAGFSILIYHYGLGYLMILSPLIVITEILLGISLILLINPRLHSLVVLIFLILFSVSFAYANYFYGIKDCGCFGTLQPSNVSPFFTFIRNFILIAISIVLWIKYPPLKNNNIDKWKKFVILGVMFITIFIAGFTFRTPFFFYKNRVKHKYENVNIKVTKLSNYIRTSKDKSYLIFCFSYSCTHCWNSIENLRQFRKTNMVDSIITLATGKESDKLLFIKNFRPDFYIYDLPLDTLTQFSKVFPTAFFIKNDTIKVIIQSELPSPVTFLQNEKHFIKN